MAEARCGLEAGGLDAGGRGGGVASGIRRWAFVLGVAGACGVALGNPTAAGLATEFHLTLGMVFIVLVEGIVAVAFGARGRRRAFLLVLAANVLSGWIGVLLVASTRAVWPADGLALRWVPTASVVAFVVMAVLGLVIEFPLLWLAFPAPRRTRATVWRAVKAGLVGGAITNAGVAWLYSLTTADSLVTRYRELDGPGGVVRGTEPAETAWVYFIDERLENVRRVRLDGTGEEVVLEGPVAKHKGLFVSLAPDGTLEVLVMDLGLGDLLPRRDDALLKEEGVRVVASDAGEAGSMWWSGSESPAMADWPWRPAELRSAGRRAVEYKVSRLPHRGIQATRMEDEVAGETWSIALAGALRAEAFTPGWVTTLDDGVLVFELRDGDWDRQWSAVYVLNEDRRTFARLCRGRRPVVVLERAAEGWKVE